MRKPQAKNTQVAVFAVAVLQVLPKMSTVEPWSWQTTVF